MLANGGSFKLEGPAAAYIADHGFRPNEIKMRLHAATVEKMGSKLAMLGSDIQGAMITQLLLTMNAKKVIEVGVFTGYTTLSIALGLPVDGKVVACDISEEYTNIGKPFWEEAGVSHKIDLVIGSAVESMDRLIADGQAGTFDFAFIDADKEGYQEYYERSLTLLRPGGSIFVDNCCYHWDVLNDSPTKSETHALRRLNDIIRNDSRVLSVLLPIADGTHFVTKLSS
jgi:predicted O-methyltransferase YrrM